MYRKIVLGEIHVSTYEVIQDIPTRKLHHEQSGSIVQGMLN